jgi:hypothetical protein
VSPTSPTISVVPAPSYLGEGFILLQFVLETGLGCRRGEARSDNGSSVNSRIATRLMRTIL